MTTTTADLAKKLRDSADDFTIAQRVGFTIQDLQRMKLKSITKNELRYKMICWMRELKDILEAES